MGGSLASVISDAAATTVKVAARTQGCRLKREPSRQP
jgi:hypothetical protein